MRVRFVQSGRRASRAVSNWEGPCGASVGVFGREPSFGVDGVGVTALQQGVSWHRQRWQTRKKEWHTCRPPLQSPANLPYH
jgi:hypothetical protein